MKFRSLSSRSFFLNYNRLLGYGFILFVLSVLSITLVIDPYGLLRLVDLPEFNKSKPRMYNNARMVKAYYATEIKPRGLIIGSSRADVGLNADVAGSMGISSPVYNSSLPSARIREIDAYIRHAHTVGNLNQVVIGLDYFMFDANAPHERGFEKGRLELENNNLVWLERIKDYFRAFFSYDALEAAIYTLMNQEKYAVSYLDNGGQDPRTRQRNINEKGGHRAAFKAALRETVTSRDAIALLRYESSSFENNGELASLYKMLSFCQDENIDVYLAISPTHALWSQAIWELGIWPKYERWKRDINDIVEQIRVNTDNKAVLELWDFSGFSEINKEEPPVEGDQNAIMRWYWEASHYKHETGNLVISRLMGNQDRDIPADFGVRLNKANINKHLKKLRKDRERYFRVHQEAVSLLWEVLHEVRSMIQGS